MAQPPGGVQPRKPKRKVKTLGGQLAELAPQSTTQAAEQQGIVAPRTPAAAKTIGATPDQAASTGTPNQRAGARQLQRQERMTQGPSAQQQAATEQARQKAQRLESLGSLGTRVENLVQSYIQQTTAQPGVTQQDLSVNADVLAQRFPDDPAAQAQAETALEQYAQTGSEADLRDAMQVLGLESTNDLAAYFQGAPELLGARAEGITPETVTLQDIGLDQLGEDPAQLAEDLGVTQDELAQMTPQELQDQAEAVQSQAFQEIRSLKAELANAGPNRAQEIMSRLRELGQAGLTGVERNVESLTEDIAQGRQVKFGEDTYEIQDLLNDEVISETIREAATNDAALEQLRENHPDLADWVTDNKAALETLAEEMEAEVGGLRDVQAEFKDLVGDIPADLLGKFTGETPELLTSGELKDLKAKLDDDPVYQVFQDSEAFRVLAEEDPGLIDQIREAGFSADQTETAAELLQARNRDPLLKELISEGQVLNSPEALETAAAYRDTYERIPDATRAEFGEDIERLVKRGYFTGNLDRLRRLADPNQGPKILNAIRTARDHQAEIKKAAKATRMRPVAEALFGKGTTWDDARATYLQALKRPNNPKAAAFRRRYQRYFDFNQDGVVTAKELKRGPKRGSDFIRRRVQELLQVNKAFTKDPAEKFLETGVDDYKSPLERKQARFRELRKAINQNPSSYFRDKRYKDEGKTKELDPTDLEKRKSKTKLPKAAKKDLKKVMNKIAEIYESGQAVKQHPVRREVLKGLWKRELRKLDKLIRYYPEQLKGSTLEKTYKQLKKRGLK